MSDLTATILVLALLAGTPATLVLMEARSILAEVTLALALLRAERQQAEAERRRGGWPAHRPVSSEAWQRHIEAKYELTDEQVDGDTWRPWGRS